MEGWGILQQAADLARRGESFALATVVWRQGPSSSQEGARAIITADGEVHGWIGGACAEPVVIREARQIIASGVARLLLLGNPEQFGYSGDRLPAGMTFVPIACQSEGALEVFIEPMLPVPHLVIVGNSPMTGTLGAMARALGWQADLIAGQDFTAADVSERSLVVVATQGHDDEGVLERAVAARPAYLGLVGSDRRGEAVLGYLAERGVDAATLAKVRVPAGLDLGRTTHQEIAVAILAELVQVRAQLPVPAAQRLATSDSVSARTVSGTTSTDPVCGMTVTVGPASRSSQHGDRTYYFCGPGCQQAFDADPAAYVERESRC
jgi:xanthine dehydrogenase accessory factor